MPSNPETADRNYFPEAYKWGGAKHAELLDQRQTLLSHQFSGGLLPFGEDEWTKLQCIRGLLDAIEEEQAVGSKARD
jgi:hypothetical protein